MNDFGVLNSRKRAVIALIHSFVFLGIAMHGFVSPKQGVLRGFGATADYALIAIYLVVASILGWLVGISRCARERIYFALCTCSASVGLLRAVFGDAALPIAQYMRVILLSSGSWLGCSSCVSSRIHVQSTFFLNSGRHKPLRALRFTKDWAASICSFPTSTLIS